MSTSSWKNKLTEKQLAKKRLSDKLTQRRLRQQSKYFMTELEHHTSLLTSGHVGTLINCLLDRNAALRAKIFGYQTSLRSIAEEVMTCLESEHDDYRDLDSRSWLGIASVEATDTRSSAPLTSDQFNLKELGGAFAQAELSVPSIYHHLYHIFGAENFTDSSIPVNGFLELIMTWKSVRGYSVSGLQFLLDYFGLTQEPWNLTLDHLNERAQSKFVLPDILEALLYSIDIPCDRESTDQEPLQLSEMQKLRRAIAIIAYEKCRAWANLIKKPLERLSVFWADYTYFLMLVFPTAENYAKIPDWRKPTPSQFRLDHPNVLDGAMWPRLRTHLLTSSGYELADVCLKLAECLQMRIPRDFDIGTAARLTPDMSDIYLGPIFEKAVNDGRNFNVDPQFDKYYPELAALIRQDINSPLLTSCPSSPENRTLKQDSTAPATLERAPKKSLRRRRGRSSISQQYLASTSSSKPAAVPQMQEIDVKNVDQDSVVAASLSSLTGTETRGLASTTGEVELFPFYHQVGGELDWAEFSSLDPSLEAFAGREG